MSYVFDTQISIWNRHIRPLVAEKDDTLAMLFEMVMEDMHDANHKVPSADGVFKGDGINHDKCVNGSIRRLEEYVKGLNETEG